MQISGCSFFYHFIAIALYMPMYKIMKEVKKHIQNWKDIRIADIKLDEIAVYNEKRRR